MLLPAGGALRALLLLAAGAIEARAALCADADTIADLDVGHCRTSGGDGAHDLMTHDHGVRLGRREEERASKQASRNTSQQCIALRSSNRVATAVSCAAFELTVGNHPESMV